MKRIIFLYCFICLTAIFSSAQNFKSIVVKPEKAVLGNPVIRLGSDDKIDISFDEINEEARYLQYKIVHCNADWSPSELSPIRVYAGAMDNSISDVSFSMNTHIDYTHYHLIFPDDYTNILISGNYKLEIYDFSESDEALFDVKFFVIEDNTFVKAKISRPMQTKFNSTCQQLSFSISSDNVFFKDIYRNLNVFVQQNGRIDEIRKIEPQYVVENVLNFTDNDNMLFYGGNDFRNFDIRSIESNLQTIQKIQVENEVVNAYLRVQHSDGGKVYFGNDDINGEYAIDAWRKFDAQTEADYVDVHFTLKTDFLGKDAGVYVFGALTNWELNDGNLMDYDFEYGSYYATLRLKQGFYDFLFAVLPKNSEVADISFFEGSHYETENNYNIYVYYRSDFDDYDRLLQLITINSKN